MGKDTKLFKLAYLISLLNKGVVPPLDPSHMFDVPMKPKKYNIVRDLGKVIILFALGGNIDHHHPGSPQEKGMGDISEAGCSPASPKTHPSIECHAHLEEFTPIPHSPKDSRRVYATPTWQSGSHFT